MSLYIPKHAKSGIYHFEFEYRGHRFRGSTGCASKDKARQFERAKRQEIAKAVLARPTGSKEPMTWELASTLYWDEVGQHHVNSETTLWSLDWLTREIGKATKISDITNAVVARLVAKRRGQAAAGKDSRVSAGTVNRSVTEPLRKVLLRARNIFDQQIATIRWADHLLKEPRERVRELQADEEARLFAVLREDYAPAIRFALLTGCRRSEIVGLTWADVDFGNRRIWINGKGAKRAPIPMPPSVRDLLFPLQGHHPTSVFAYVVERPRLLGPRARRGDRSPITTEGLKTAFRRAVSEAGLVAYRFHDNRHTAATRVLRAGGSLRTVQTLLRHDLIETTTKYAHVTDADVMAAMEAAAVPSKAPAGDIPKAESAKRIKPL